MSPQNAKEGTKQGIWADLTHQRWQDRLNAVTLDRRVKKVRRFFWRWRDDINLLWFTVWTFVVGVVSIFAYDMIAGMFR